MTRRTGWPSISNCAWFGTRDRAGPTVRVAVYRCPASNDFNARRCEVPAFRRGLAWCSLGCDRLFAWTGFGDVGFPAEHVAQLLHRQAGNHGGVRSVIPRHAERTAIRALAVLLWHFLEHADFNGPSLFLQARHLLGFLSRSSRDRASPWVSARRSPGFYHGNAKRRSESFAVRPLNAARVREATYIRTPQIACIRVCPLMSAPGRTGCEVRRAPRVRSKSKRWQDGGNRRDIQSTLSHAPIQRKRP